MGTQGAQRSTSRRPGSGLHARPLAAALLLLLAAGWYCSGSLASPAAASLAALEPTLSVVADSQPGTCEAPGRSLKLKCGHQPAAGAVPAGLHRGYGVLHGFVICRWCPGATHARTCVLSRPPPARA